MDRVSSVTDCGKCLIKTRVKALVFSIVPGEKCFSAKIDSGGVPGRDIIASNLYKFYASQSYRIHELAEAIEGVILPHRMAATDIWENA